MRVFLLLVILAACTQPPHKTTSESRAHEGAATWPLEAPAPNGDKPKPARPAPHSPPKTPPAEAPPSPPLPTCEVRDGDPKREILKKLDCLIKIEELKN